MTMLNTRHIGYLLLIILFPARISPTTSYTIGIPGPLALTQGELPYPTPTDLCATIWPRGQRDRILTVGGRKLDPNESLDPSTVYMLNWPEAPENTSGYDNSYKIKIVLPIEATGRDLVHALWGRAASRILTWGGNELRRKERVYPPLRYTVNTSYSPLEELKTLLREQLNRIPIEPEFNKADLISAIDEIQDPSHNLLGWFLGQGLAIFIERNESGVLMYAELHKVTRDTHTLICNLYPEIEESQTQLTIYTGY